MNRSRLDVTLAVGYLAVAAGLLVARANPATAYESSVYTGSPTGVWVGFALALAIAVGTALTCRGRRQGLGIALGAMTVTAIASLPVIRNYRFLGMGDPMTHLGWTRDIVAGGTAPHELFYPGLHAIASVFHLVGGVSIERALLFGMVVLFVPFLLFVPLTVREMADSGLAVGLAAIVSWMVLPVNNIATHMAVHTNSNALFLVPPVVFAVVAYLRRRATIERLPLGLSPFSVLLALTAIALLLVHPQQMFNVVVLIGAITGVQYLARWRFDDHPMLEHPTLAAQTLLLGGLFGLWALGNERFRSSAIALVSGLLTDDTGAGNTVNQRGTSLTEIGGSLPELFVKLFLDAAIVGLIVGLFVLVVWVRRSSLADEPRAFVNYVSLALVPLGGLFGAYFLGTPTMAFRQVGFIYVLLTILAGIALAQLVGGLSKWITRPGANAVAALVLGGCLVLGLLTMFASPLIYNPGQHVTPEMMSGYEDGLEHGANGTPHVGMGYDPYRYDHGINGLAGNDTLSSASAATGTANATVFSRGNYSGAYPTDEYYFVYTEWDRTKEIDIYDQLNYRREALEGMDRYRGANKVISNDEFEMYAVRDA
ncbi:hypothetical protein C488_01519 [Natrinema pellirubrum DSM 15624]|uniref:Glycosyltransferase RgtA/B/C/D-like domain-containing protein n=1 Tax=Natrinema pellirubrum (strain DSM 15624 / CIP 106293 / JCM 10476 / NCIMB 786 / 157) TaxID=797303 RepID=L9Z6A4_NATP1|nr:hypothetical protein [Natrinema pellirubrum]ELY81446.1 hypothetical protein C488_01519 [Natrinema pellirubrum DSM 15624]